VCAVKLQSIHTYERVTKDVSAETSAAIDVIPLVIGIKLALAADKRHGTADNEKEIINDMNIRFADVAAMYLQLCQSCSYIISLSNGP